VDITASFPHHTVIPANPTQRHSRKKGGNPVTSLPSADLAVLSSRDRPALSIVSSRFFPISCNCFAMHGSFSWILASAGMTLWRQVRCGGNDTAVRLTMLSRRCCRGNDAVADLFLLCATTVRFSDNCPSTRLPGKPFFSHYCSCVQ